MARIIISFPDPQARDLAMKLVDGQGRVFSPSAAAFADHPADAAIPLTKVKDSELATNQVGIVPNLPADSGPVLIFVVPAAGGPAVDEPVPVVAADDVTPYGVAFQI